MKKFRLKNGLIIFAVAILAVFIGKSSAIAKSSLPMVEFFSFSSSSSETIIEAYLPVRLSKPSKKNVVSVDNAVTVGFAAQGIDYKLTAGTLTFQPGETSKDIDLEVIDDDNVEADETLVLTLSNPVKGHLGDSQTHTVTIHNEDTSAEFSQISTSVSENPGTPVIEVKLSNPVSKIVTIDYAVTGGIASGTSEGSGQDYDLQTGTLTFKPGETVTTIPLVLVTDDINEFDETVEIALSNPKGATLGGKKTHTLTIIDSNRKVLANVKDYGAKGDGVTDDTAAIQKAVNDVYAKGGGVILFPSGTYMVTSVNIRENITYQGDQATIKRPPMQGKWLRTFTTQKSSYAGTGDSKPLVIKNLNFDGNSQNQGSYKNHELEQAHLIFLMGNPARPGRLKAIIENCHFQNGVGDAISTFVNVDLKVFNCEAENVFRGGWVLTGGNSKAYIKNLITRGDIDPTGIDIEVDGKGYEGSYNVSVVLEDVTCADGDCDLGLGGNSTLVATRLKSLAPHQDKNSFLFYGSGRGTYQFNDCEIYTNRSAHVQSPGNITFNRCKFIATDKGAGTAAICAFPFIIWNSSYTSFKNQSISLNNCTFTTDATVNPAAPRFGLKYSRTIPLDNNLLQINGGEFSSRLDRGIGNSSGGGKIILSGVIFNVNTSSGTYPLNLSGCDANSANWDVTIDNCQFNTTSYIYIYGYSGATTCINNFLRQGNIIINKTTNSIGTFAGILNNNYLGLGSIPVMRIIKGVGEPKNTPGFKSADGKFFDQYRDMADPANPVYYKCTNMNPYTWTRYTP